MATPIEEKLGLLTYKKPPQSHISIVDPSVCLERCPEKPCTAICPANVYEWNETRKAIAVSYENCIECGGCRMICPFYNIDCEWPGGGAGVQYKYG
ncbi:MAG: 4Fe-4S dicluster domain-containing protein [Elusimicrobia bacterium]|nr:4Fe-4S dicluster domain-containing protein [Elusimicrobiota bacterium]